MVKSVIRFIKVKGNMNDLSANERGMLWVLYECLRNAFGLKFQSIPKTRGRKKSVVL